MPTTAHRFEHNGHTYELHDIEEDPVWNLYEEFGDEAALVGLIIQRGSQFTIECYWKPGPGAHDIDATTVDEAVTALLALTEEEDPRARQTLPI
jgi:hypothetical protein